MNRFTLVVTKTPDGLLVGRIVGVAADVTVSSASFSDLCRRARRELNMNKLIPAEKYIGSVTLAVQN